MEENELAVERNEEIGEGGRGKGQENEKEKKLTGNARR